MYKIRVGVVGPGLIWKRAHKPALDLLSERVVVTAFSASSEKTRQEVEHSYPGVPFYSDYHELVASPLVDWVLVLTPIALNAPVALAALQAGKDVFLEKPMARTLAEGEALVRLANETGRRLYVLEQAVYPSSLDTVEEVIRSGEIGEVLTYDVVAHEIFDATPEHSVGGYGATSWRIHPDFPMGPLLTAAITRLPGSAVCLAGRPRSMRPGARSGPPMASWTTRSCSLSMTAACGIFQLQHGAQRAQELFPHPGHPGILSLERHRMIIDHNDGDQRTITHPVERAYEAMWRALLAAIEEGRDPYYTKERAFQDPVDSVRHPALDPSGSQSEGLGPVRLSKRGGFLKQQFQEPSSHLIKGRRGHDLDGAQPQERQTERKQDEGRDRAQRGREQPPEPPLAGSGVLTQGGRAGRSRRRPARSRPHAKGGTGMPDRRAERGLPNVQVQHPRNSDQRHADPQKDDPIQHRTQP